LDVRALIAAFEQAVAELHEPARAGPEVRQIGLDPWSFFARDSAGAI
jgi:hypothetical protein